ncbi:MAG: tryptophan synthase subunit alpha [Nitrospinae bacterium]|nr:tryptophan synthase subunit alpha [Nitrospinota bacterium]
MNGIEGAFARLKRDKRKALVIFLAAGDPSMKATVELVKAAERGGADIVEIGVPFSDPLADGPVIQESFGRAIAKGATLARTFEMVKKIRKESTVPLVFMLTVNLVVNHGVGKFFNDCAAAGVDGIILPDAPPEEAGEFVPSARAAGLCTIMLAAPTSTTARMKKIASIATGFVYYITIKGVTGKTKAVPADAARGIKSLKRLTKLPVLAGFGVTEPSQAKQMAKVSDGVIIGSQAIRVIKGAGSAKKGADALYKYVASVRKAIDSA